MEALKLFSKYAPNKTFIAILLGSLAGLFYAFLIPVVLRALSGDNTSFEVENKLIELFGVEVAHSKFAFLFFSLCILILIFRSLAEITLARLALDIRFNLRKELYDQVQNSPIASLEKIGPSRLIQALSTDVAAIIMGAQLFPQLLTSGVTLLGMLGFLAYLEFSVFSFVMKIIIFGVIAYQIPIWIGTKYFAKAREHRDILQDAFKALIEGAKELKLNDNKKQVYNTEVLHKQENIVKELEKKGATIYTLASNLGDLLCFFAIGGLGFVFINYNVISTAEVIAAIMVLLYVTGPIAMILNFIPQLARTGISLKKIDRLYQELPDEQVSNKIIPIKPWSRLRLDKVTYRYPLLENQSNSFEIGPLSLEIKRGEITFIAGGNGSGKSTLAKLITQHYLAKEGEIYFDSTKIDSTNLTSFRQEVSCIYSDYYLFDRLLDTKSLSKDYVKHIEHYLKAFGIDDKVQIRDGHFSTLKLSDGQRRRLALVITIVEDKSILLFDEWAADQDPQFKYVFYREILPDLKRKNKAVVVISHDDRYFDIADQLLIMESGRLVDPQETLDLFTKNDLEEPILI